ncbi:DoxX family protein [Nocardia beijingensis]|uniref:DoxX family protein n=1 Tax=Nocardia beijingensis TaxID=95162 RepID=UPI0033D526CE
MTIASIVLAALLALEMIAVGAPKVLAVQAMRERATHAGIPVSGYRVIGALEIVGAAGLLIGIGWHPIGRLAGVAIVLLMVGALITHVRAKDKLADMIPAIVTALLAVTYLVVASLAR